MEIKISKIKLDKESKLSISYSRNNKADQSNTEVNEDHDKEAHPDFRAALKGLSPHFAIFTGYLRTADFKNIEDEKMGPPVVEYFHPSGFSIKGEDDNRGFVITGHRILPDGKAVILNTPFYRFETEDKSKEYKFMSQLVKAFSAVEDEAKKYLGGKFAPDPQQSLNFKEGDETK